MSDAPRAADAHPHVSMVENPPSSILGILSRLGPGLIIAGSIVGSGELIATTSTGGKAGYTLLWLILIGCVIKVFVQVEFGRYSIITGKTTMDGLNEVPGPKLRMIGNWLIWYWFIMAVSSLGQLGGIVGGVGQAMAISLPITQAGRDFNEFMGRKTKVEVSRAELAMVLREAEPDPQRAEKLRADIAALEGKMQEASQSDSRYQLALDLWKNEARFAELEGDTSESGTAQRQNIEEQIKLQRDTLKEESYKIGEDRLWAWILTIATSILLVVGRYRLLEFATTALVAGFTAVTVINVVLLQMHELWGMTWADLQNGLSFQLPPETSSGGTSAIAMALATFGIIGVGTNELLAYPYFCLEKGYARFTGPRDESEPWARRARGWMRVMRADAWCSMVIYTFATVAFYFLGAAILHPLRLDPKGPEMIRTLAVMYEPIFGSYAPALFLVGAFAVLYSTFFVANAGHSRVAADVARVLSHGRIGQKGFHTGVTVLSGVLPFVCLFMYLAYGEPRDLILFSGFMQALMLPMLAGAALFFRYCRMDERIKPSPVWDFFLWLSAAGLLVVALWAVYDQAPKIMEMVQ